MRSCSKERRRFLTLPRAVSVLFVFRFALTSFQRNMHHLLYEFLITSVSSSPVLTLCGISITPHSPSWPPKRSLVGLLSADRPQGELCLAFPRPLQCAYYFLSLNWIEKLHPLRYYAIGFRVTRPCTAEVMITTMTFSLLCPIVVST